MKRFVLYARVALTCAALFALSGTALAGPDLSGKSDTFKANYQAFYVACLEKSTGGAKGVAACEADAMRKAESTDYKQGMVSDTVPGLKPNGPVATQTGIASPPPFTDEVKAWQADMQKYADYDFVIRVPVKITNFRFNPYVPLEDAQPHIYCRINSSDGNALSEFQPLPVTMKEGDSFDDVVVVAFKKDETWAPDSKMTTSVCSLQTHRIIHTICNHEGYDGSTSLCKTERTEDGEFIQSFH